MRPPPSCLHLLRVVPAQVGDSDRAAHLAVLLSRKASDGIDNDQIMSCTGCQRQRPDRPKLLPPRSLTDEVTATCLDLLLLLLLRDALASAVRRLWENEVELDATRCRAAELEERLH
uniref:Uncharacterized protein n=1 Tax=Oryza nivara TaxID=4536 RepID=A0A0E0G489_ORYNI